MKILFDHNVNRRFRKHLPGHSIQTTHEQGWEQLSNGILLKTAADAGFEVFVTVDKNIEYQQNLKALPIAIVVIDSTSNALTSLVPFAPSVLRLLAYPIPCKLYVVQADGTAIPVDAPRRP